MKKIAIALAAMLAMTATTTQAATCADRNHVVKQLETNDPAALA